MASSAIINILETYLLLGALVAGAICAAFLLVYFAVYRRVAKGGRTLSLWKLALWAAFICYLVVIAGAVILSRSSGVYSSVDLHLFSSYREAYYKFSVTEWRNIILNIAMFVPLGAMLPLMSERMRGAAKVMGAGLAATALVESLQAWTGMGMFEADDIFNNVLGTLIGYGAAMAGLALAGGGRRRALCAVCWLAPLLLAASAFAAIFVCYDRQELGNLPYANYYFRHDMGEVELTRAAGLDLDVGVSEAAVYRAETASRERADAFAADFFESLGGLAVGRAEAGDRAARYFTEDGAMSLAVSFKGMTWEFEDASKAGGGGGFQADGEALRGRLASLGAMIPEGAAFQADGGGGFTYTARAVAIGGKLVNGTLFCECLDDGSLKAINNRMVEYSPVKTMALVSAGEAYGRIESGRFNCMRRETPGRIEIKSVWLDYSLDTKGFFQPIYRFKAEFDGEPGYILTPALDLAGGK